MALTITNESKNDLTISNTEKDSDLTWEESNPMTWDDESGVWSNPKRPFVNEDKIALSITNEDKN